MGLMKEMKTLGFEVFLEEPIVHCKAFEDNSGAIELARLPKIRPRTIPINVVFHHFHYYVHKGIIDIQQVSMDYQCVDAWNKPLTQKKKS